MAYDIGPKVGIEGEAEFKKAIADINRSLKTMGTEMKAVTSAYDSNDKSAEKLGAQNEVLNKQIDAQKNKLDELKSMLDKSKAAYGENDAQTQKYQQAVNLATADLNKMERELKNNEAALDGTAKGLEDAGKAADDSGARFEKLGGALKASAVAMGAVVVAAGAAAAKLGKEVLSAFGDYEQLVGGVDTLFKDSSSKLQEYAAGAYKTAGLSANDYMETVTGFSASLIQSLGGDTEKAVEYADMAITDMSDNANKMGTDMASIQNAYQGFAKQNYTMLDNLKLGYGGTKTEMERLLKDAGKIAGVKFDISSYADVVEAIHVMQESMGIAGTTALEAEETIQGSIKAMSSAWGNMLVGFGNADADMAALTGMLVDSFQAVVANITPVIDNIAKALPEAFDAALGAVGNLLPTLLSTVTDLFKQVLSTLLRILPELIPVAVDAVMTIVDTIIENLPLIIDGAFELITALAEGLIEALPELVPKIVEVVTKIVETIIKNLPLIIGAALKIIIALASGLIKAIPELVKAVPTLIMSIVTAFAEGWEIIKDIGVNIVKGIWEGITGMAGWLAGKVKGFVDSIVSAFTGKDGIDAHSPSRLFATFGSYMAQGIGEGFTAEMQNVARQINGSIPVVRGRYDISGNAPGKGKTGANINHVVNIYSPTPLSPSQVARENRNAIRRLSWA